MYDSKFVACVKANGKILREVNDMVYVPFGTEFSILLKNLNTAKAKVKVFIDGDDATEATQLVIESTTGNNSLELTRFIKNGNLNSGNRFKFIERTRSIKEHRGIRDEDGLIRVEFEFELQSPPFTSPAIGPNWYQSPNQSPLIFPTYGSFARSSSIGARATTCSDSVKSQVGITVPGSVSEQKFSAVPWFLTDGRKHSIVIRLLGKSGDVEVSKPITVKTKSKCQTRGRLNKITSKFCSNCGTCLQIIA